MSTDDQFTEFCIMSTRPGSVSVIHDDTGVSLHDAAILFEVMPHTCRDAGAVEQVFQVCWCIRKCAEMCGTEYMLLYIGDKQCIVHKSSYDKLKNSEVGYIVKQFPGIFGVE